MNDETDLLMKRFWNNCYPSFAHLTPRKKYPKELYKKYFNLKNKIVLDFGGGGGHLGKFLFDEFKIAKYVDIDISERSLSVAKKTLKGYNAYFCLNINQSFELYKADFLLCRAVIHHFPNVEYLNNFLSNVNDSKIADLLLSIKSCTNENYKFIEDSYKKNILAVRSSCLVHPDYISEKLTNYSFIHKHGVHNQYSLIFKLISL